MGLQLQVSKYNFLYLRHSHINYVRLNGLCLNFMTYLQFLKLMENATDFFAQKIFLKDFFNLKFVIDVIN